MTDCSLGGDMHCVCGHAAEQHTPTCTAIVAGTALIPSYPCPCDEYAP